MHLQSSLLGITLLYAVAITLPLTPSTVSTARALEIAQSGSTVAPIGQINPNESVTMTIVNGTSFPLFAGISGGTRVELEQGDSTNFTFDATPINVFVYPAGQGASLKYSTTIRDNTITVQVTQVAGDTPGDGTINIRPSGSIYVF